MNHLSPEEAQVLRHYITNRSKTQYFEFSDGVVSGLVAESVLYRPSNMSALTTTFAFSLGRGTISTSIPSC